MKGRKLPLKTKKKMSKNFKSFWSKEGNKERMRTIIKSLPDKKFKCEECGNNFLSRPTAHPKYCKKCRKLKYKILKKDYYLKNKEKINLASKKSQKEFIKKYGVARTSLIKHGLSTKRYQEISKNGCYVCKFKEVLDIHRVIFGSNEKIIVLCPNHHAMVHRKGLIIKV